MCGEHAGISSFTMTGVGSSPHVRGAHVSELADELPVGIIPACAGSTPRRLSRNPARRDHPRMCGEHVSGSRGRSPRSGSSPHVRGAPWPSRRGLALGGIIPACAGSTHFRLPADCLAWDHPRMCGEHRTLTDEASEPWGSSPHVRGAQAGLRHAAEAQGIIPACAGSTCCPSFLLQLRWDHPRMCGEHPIPVLSQWMAMGSSPHVRGAQCRQTICQSISGIIPACAGSTLRK